MSFDALLQKVKQAETALEAQERRAAADWRQLKGSWRELWTPGRIVIAGLVSGFLVGRAEPFKRAAGGGALQLLSALSGLFASGSAQAAAGEAGHAADNAQQTAAAAGVPAAAAAQAATAPEPLHELSPETTQQILRRAGLP
jgi:hypothetical protein